MKQIYSSSRTYLSNEIRRFGCLIEKFIKPFRVAKNLPIFTEVLEVENFTETAELVLARTVCHCILNLPEVFLLFDILPFPLGIIDGLQLSDVESMCDIEK